MVPKVVIEIQADVPSGKVLKRLEVEAYSYTSHRLAEKVQRALEDTLEHLPLLNIKEIK